MSDVTRRMAKSETPVKATPPHDAIGRLPLYACHHWTGYGIESELCHNYLHLLTAVKAILKCDPFDCDAPSGTSDELQAALDSAQKAVAKAEEK
jgi:hypothetical protein